MVELRNGFVRVVLSGRPFQVPAEHAKSFLKKDKLVYEATVAKMALKDETLPRLHRSVIEGRLTKLMGKIIRLNRRIPPCAFPL
jgi:hypothetical protein